MKTKLLILLLNIMSIGLFAQSLVPGTYRYKSNQNEAKISLNGNEVTFNAWRTEFKCTKVSESRYTNPEQGTYIEVVSKDLIILGNENNGYKEELVLYAPDNGEHAEGLIAFEWNGNKYFAIEDKENKMLAGEYSYEGGEPKVVLSPSLTQSYFQRHGVAPTNIIWWGIETNYKGEIQKITGDTGNYRMILVVKYGEGDQYTAPNSFDRKQITVLPNEKKTLIMGERVYQWN